MSLPKKPEEIGREIGESFNKLPYPKFFLALYLGSGILGGVIISYYFHIKNWKKKIYNSA